ncbi:MAG: hypothetical protein Q4D80_00930 [Pseudomonadota bacterium]|nr:hypothetical protein [Pseudomonadota bacterium]
MIKKLLHYICVLAAGSVWSVALLLLYQFVFFYFYQIDIVSPLTYKTIGNFWNNGGILKSGDLLMIFGMFTYFPVVFIGWKFLAKYSYLKLISKPLSWLSNIGLGKYNGGMPEVNIKNLKVEEKKTIEQLVQERIEQENKKIPKTDTAKFRKEIIEKIENEIN